MKRLIAYVPVIHQGYLELIGGKKVDSVEIFAPDLIAQFDYLRKEIRAVEPEKIVSSLRAIFPNLEINLLTVNRLKNLVKEKGLELVAASEDINRQLVEKYFPKTKIAWSPIFLRWDRDSAVVNKDVEADEEIDVSDGVAAASRHRKMLAKAFAVADQSSDWWRHVGAVLAAANGKIISAGANHHLPSDQTPYIFGDPRSLFKRGQHVDLGTAAHAESTLIARAAQTGISLKDAKLYLTDFPCPYCARMVAASGIGEIYFAQGYAMLDGAEILHHAGVKIIKLNIPEKIHASTKSIAKPYPTKH